MLTIYKASAGSGKTFTLSSTFIAHLVSGHTDNAHKHLLAVTFTNKATAEMKERILQNLYAIAFDHNDDDGFFKAVRAELPHDLPPATIRQRARNVLFSLIHDYDHFHVKTIDSFFQSLLANLAHEVGLSASFKVEIDDKNILKKAVDRFLTGVTEKSDELEWLMSFVSQRLEEDTSWNVAGNLQGLAKELLKERYMQRRQLLHRKELSAEELEALPQSIDLTNDIVKKYRAELKKREQTLREELAAVARQTDEAIRNSLGYENILSGERYLEPSIKMIADKSISYSTLQDKFKTKKTLRNYANDPSKILSAKNRKNATLCRQRDMVGEYLQRLVKAYDDSAYECNSCALSLKNIYPLRLLDSIDREVEALNRENDRFMLAYTPLLFDKLTGDADTSFIFERANTQFDHVMIDEFQDTSPLQWKNMRHLLVENLAQGNSCMLVGDVKQGIYRFRGGDWNTLADFKEESYDGIKTTDIRTLKQNFRSGKEIVAFNNRLFTAAPAIIDSWLAEMWGLDSENLPPHLSACRIYPIPDPENDNHEVTQLSVKDGGYVKITLFKNDSDSEKDKKSKANDTKETATPDDNAAEGAQKEEENVENLLAKEIRELHDHGVPYQEMAILVRYNSDTAPILRHFETNFPDIPLVSEEAFLLDASPAVQTLIHALKYIVNTKDDIAREYIVKHIPHGKKEETLQRLEEWNREQYGKLPFYEIVTRLITILNLDEAAGQSPYLYCFLDTILHYIEENPSDIKEFLRSWDDNLHNTFLPSAAIKGVRILTIHKSKGLAFHSVFVPYSDWRFNNPSRPERVWESPDTPPYNKIPLLPIDLHEKAGNSIYRDTYRQEMYNQFIENLNILYVTFTRAKQNLLVWGKPSKGDKTINMANLLREAMKRAGLTASDAEDTGDTIYTTGEPSRLDIKSDDNPEATDNATQGTKSAHPLEYHARIEKMTFRAPTSSPHFRQSQSARLFIEMEQGMADDADTANAANEAAQRETFRQTGILLHQLMSTIETADDVPEQVAAFVREGKIADGQPAENLEKLIRKRIQHPTARKWFDGTWKLYREATLIFRDSQGQMVTKRPDRVMKREGETVVVDFKFGRPKPEYADQIREYASLLRRQDGTSVKAYLWYLYSGGIDEVNI